MTSKEKVLENGYRVERQSSIGRGVNELLLVYDAMDGTCNAPEVLCGDEAVANGHVVEAVIEVPAAREGVTVSPQAWRGGWREQVGAAQCQGRTGRSPV